MADKNPEKCHRCAKFKKTVIHKQCRICQEVWFEETTLCHLNRCVQESDNFTCYAFRPGLDLIASSVDPIARRVAAVKTNLQDKPFLNLLNSHKIKYQKALALQKLKRNPDEEFVELKYHLAWNVIHRQSIFEPEQDHLDLIHDTLFRSGELVRAFAGLLWLAPDHMHVYVNSDGHKSIQQITHALKQSLQDAIVSKFPKKTPGHETETNIWDESYFSETIG